MKKITSIIKYLLLGISVVALIPVFTSGENGVDFILTWAAILLGLAIVITILLAGFNIFKNPKGAIGSLIGIGIMVVVLGISYALSSAEPIITPVDVFDSPAELRITDTGLYTAYIVFAAAILAAIFGEVRNSFK